MPVPSAVALVSDLDGVPGFTHVSVALSAGADGRAGGCVGHQEDDAVEVLPAVAACFGVGGVRGSTRVAVRGGGGPAGGR